MSDKLLSVVVPIYNVESYLPQCIESILCQTYTDLEIILVDDGSTDSSGEIADNYKKTDSRIRVVHKQNGGLLSARYAGAAIASGEYITFVDSDDWIKPEMYQVLMSVMLEQHVDLVTSGGIRYISEDKETIAYDKLIETGYYDSNGIRDCIVPVMLWDKRSDTWAVDPAVWSKIFKTKKLFPILEKLKGEKIYFGEDSAITYSYILGIESLYCTHTALYFHRERASIADAPYLIDVDFFSKLKAVYDFLSGIFESHPCKNELKKQLDYFYMKSAQLKKYKYDPFAKRTNDYYLFPFNKVKQDSKVILYGAGKVGKDYRQQLMQLQYGEIVLWVDKNYTTINDADVLSPEEIYNNDFDYIIIAVADKGIAENIMKTLIMNGILKEKIVHNIVRCD